MTSVEPVSEPPAPERASPRSSSSAEANLGRYAKRAVVLAFVSLALFALFVGIMFTLMSTVGIVGILIVLAVVGLILVSANVTVGHRQPREEADTAAPFPAPPIPT
jgi:protein-S-isoprenylcysteine O-methyltransferase Ste14